jgi:hypothetical protein
LDKVKEVEIKYTKKPIKVGRPKKHEDEEMNELDRKEYIKKWKQQNKDKIAQSNRKYYSKNK